MDVVVLTDGIFCHCCMFWVIKLVVSSMFICFILCLVAHFSTVDSSTFALDPVDCWGFQTYIVLDQLEEAVSGSGRCVGQNSSYIV